MNIIDTIIALPKEPKGVLLSLAIFGLLLIFLIKWKN